MRDRRSVDELSIEDLERVLAIRKREERQNKLQRLQQVGRVVTPETVTLPTELPEAPAPTPPPPISTAPTFSDGAPAFEDEPAAPLIVRPAASSSAPSAGRRALNQSLLLVEILAVVGLAILGYQMFTSINRLQTETAAAQELANQQRQASIPTLEPTPVFQLSSYVLPGGHIFDAGGRALPNLDEIPANLRSVLAEQLFAPRIDAPPPVTAETALQLDIPSIGVSQTIVQGTDWEALKQGIGQFLNGVNPSDAQGNIVLSGHNDVYGEVFRNLDKLQTGDQFTVRTQTQVFTYRILETRIVSPSDVYVLDGRGGATATLISCYPYRVDDKRIVVFAERVG